MSNQNKYSALFCRELDRPDFFDRLACFRKQLFIDEYGWDLHARDGRERDEFDTDDAIHCALLHGEEIVGTFRAIRADHPYLASELFAHLATDQPLPRSKDFWEISRFGVARGSKTLRYSLLNYALMFHFANRMRASGLIALADLTYERFLKTIGINTHRYGEPSVIGKDRFGEPLEAVVGEIPLAEQSGPKYENLLQNIKLIEVHDASYVFGPVRISA